MLINFTLALTGGMLAILATARWEQIAWKFLRILTLFVFAMAAVVAVWIGRASMGDPSTAEAASTLESKRCDLIISNMRRGEEPTAGLELLRLVAADFADIPAIIFATPSTIANHGKDAERLGALACTAGAVSLLEAIYRGLASRSHA